MHKNKSNVALNLMSLTIGVMRHQQATRADKGMENRLGSILIRILKRSDCVIEQRHAECRGAQLSR